MFFSRQEQKIYDKMIGLLNIFGRGRYTRQITKYDTREIYQQSNFGREDILF